MLCDSLSVIVYVHVLIESKSWSGGRSFVPSECFLGCMLRVLVGCGPWDDRTEGIPHEVGGGTGTQTAGGGGAQTARGGGPAPKGRGA
eukprot:7378774-Prymnesium_polylepis.2